MTKVTESQAAGVCRGKVIVRMGALCLPTCIYISQPPVPAVEWYECPVTNVNGVFNMLLVARCDYSKSVRLLTDPRQRVELGAQVEELYSSSHSSYISADRENTRARVSVLMVTLMIISGFSVKIFLVPPTKQRVSEAASGGIRIKTCNNDTKEVFQVSTDEYY